jgi:hypothetical protein
LSLLVELHQRQDGVGVLKRKSPEPMTGGTPADKHPLSVPFARARQPEKGTPTATAAGNTKRFAPRACFQSRERGKRLSVERSPRGRP